ncbi:MAG: bifunctional demethylmenaquinone methyltransferase/2-methoxy-6-polyprenyl-1,4-benzoquinol methylase UbiE [Prevotellaceae bacterium]|jgi:demethylmenaquinone methyltransferase/2-methoxy-6-polyprenyl-1,4-benzoquinol methylase|nr:bifunctional demethylmenaquinone methyltransferase/2-methoxy-6-polyprenyl-1,4-benzoquinol methylase UbiE [Prevotellaceae bacterium]
MAYTVEKIVPQNSENAPKSNLIAKMFDEISEHYDLLNRTLSFGIDRYWRKKGIDTLKAFAPQKILDIATGTGDLAITACRRLRPQEILGIDISEKMMAIGRKKTVGMNIRFEQRDCTHSGLESDSFDAAIMAYGIRNFEDIDKGLQEILRILRPKGRLMILEMSVPEYFPMKQLYRLYAKLIPFVGRIFSRNKAAYSYLPESIAAFPQNARMVEILTKNGFADAQFKKLTFGVCTLYSACKN